LGAGAAPEICAEGDPLSFDLSAYLERIRLPLAPTPDAEGLTVLQRAHRLAIPFETIDIALGRGIAIESDAVFAKLVAARRGGYCFEHNRLFLDALDALGFAARPLLGRVWLDPGDGVPARTHALALVTIDGQDWIADAGFGGIYTPPLPLADGEEAPSPDGATCRLAADPEFGWMLSRRADAAAAWEAQYSFTLDRVFPTDLAIANHWSATAPGAPFTGAPIVAVPLPHGIARLVGRAYRRRNGDQATEAEIADPRVYRMRLSMMFGIDLSGDEVTALGLFGDD
jgi:N-hydroxyarylamine O-acetyltransferase